jgi:hypothetical protein
MIKLDELAPAVAQRIAEDEAHRRGCEDPACSRCGRRDARQVDRERAEIWRSMAVRRAVERIPPAYAGAALDAPWLVQLVGPDTIARSNVAIGEAHVAFVGPPGAGKTSLAAAMFRACAAADPDTGALVRYRWVSSHALAKARAGQPLGEGEAPIVDACLEASLLVLDELGGEDPRYASAVAEVLFERHAQARTTWVTTGVGPKEIAARYGGGIARRVFEGAAVFRLAGRK